jgi:UDP-N-acetylmuramyl-tripeptide synthetase
MANRGITHVVMEVSSHGIDLQRVYGCHFRCGVFTNLTRDHLDYHGTMENYFASKARLFTEVLPAFNGMKPVALINIEDPYGRRLREMSRVDTRSFHSKGPADYWIDEVAYSSKGIALTMRTPSGTIALTSPLLSEANAQNILAAGATACSLGINHDAIAQGISAMDSVPGRLEKVWQGDGFAVIVDYAHTPDALERVLSSLRSLTAGRLITVFGCGGDRDKGKRPLMGAAAARLSDVVIVTSDNPRSEPPEQIIQEILQGVQAQDIPYRKPTQLIASSIVGKTYTSEVDRREAIHLAVKMAREGDLVIIAGKGHEEVQIIGGTSHPFRDHDEVISAVTSLRRRGLSMCMS